MAATDHNDAMADFSEYGFQTVDIGAPGVDIVSTVPGGGYASFQGTSMGSGRCAVAGFVGQSNATPAIARSERCLMMMSPSVAVIAPRDCSAAR